MMFAKKNTRVQRFIQYHVLAQLASNSMRNIQSIFRTAPELCNNVSFAVLFGSNGNSYTISTQLDICVCVRVCVCVCSLQYRDTCRPKEINLGQ